jgi:predicted ATPase/DNA-binding winged helix-turn-helix (wHTH) protein
MDAPAALTFLSYRLDLQNEQLWRESQLIPLRPKTWTVLRYLVEHPGRLITKAELLTKVWEGIRVSPTLPKDYIQELRTALNDDPRAPRCIETVHGRGYRFIAPVTKEVVGPVSDSDSPIQPSQLTAQNFTAEARQGLFVGRDAELAQLHHWWAQTIAGERRVVFVTGEAGIGKTTLVDAFLEQVRRPHSGLIAHGQCFEHYGAGEAYLPMFDALGQLCREHRNDNITTVFTRYAPTWLGQMPGVLDPEEQELLRHRLQDATRERMLREMAEALEALTAQHPLILVLEDLHWSDASTLDLLTMLAQRKPPARLFVLGTYRPVDARVHDRHIHTVKNALQLHRHCEELPLHFLPETEVTAYLTARFPTSTLPPTLGPVVHHRTEGNPLFMVNLIEHLTAQGLISQQEGTWTVHAPLQVIEQSVPENLRQMIERQIEALQPQDRLLLEIASVSGIEFSTAVVAAGAQAAEESVEEQCAALARAGRFLRFQDQQEWPDGSVTSRYHFVHALYQEVLYSRLAPHRRLRLHKSMGERLETGHPHRQQDIANQLAVHFERGRDSERAVHYHHLASENALRRCAYQEAITHATQALSLLKLLPTSPQLLQQELTIQMVLGPPLIATKGYASPEVEQTYARAQELCEKFGDTPQLFPVLWGRWVMYFVRGDLAAAKKSAKHLLHLAETTHNAEFRLEACVAMGLTAIFLGDFTRARKFLEQGSALYDNRQHQSHAFIYGQDPGMVCLSWLAWTLWFLGYPEQALDKGKEAVALAQQQGLPFGLTYALGCFTALQQFRREREEVRTYAQATLANSAAQGFTLWYAAARVLLGWTLAEQQQLTEGLEEFSTGLQSWQATGAGFLQSYGLSLLPAIYQKTGLVTEGLAILDNAFTLVEQWGERFWEAELHRLKGELLFHPGAHSSNSTSTNAPSGSPTRQAEAEACFLQALAIARRQRAKSLELRATVSLCRLWRQQGKRAEARRLLQKSYAWFTEGFATADLVEARTLLDDLAT